MNRILMLIAVMLGIALSSSALAVSEIVPVGQPPVEEALAPTEAVLPQECEETILGNSQFAQAGCCSWHGGVCGCSGGRILCCDGVLSPSCGC